jgi:hypothetical protein
MTTFFQSLQPDQRALAGNSSETGTVTNAHNIIDDLLGDESNGIGPIVQHLTSSTDQQQQHLISSEPNNKNNSKNKSEKQKSKKNTAKKSHWPE